MSHDVRAVSLTQVLQGHSLRLCMQLAVTRARFVSCGTCQHSRSRPTHSAVARLNTHTNKTLSSQLQSKLSHKDAPDHGLRSGTLSATCVPPTKESLLLGPKVAHLSVPEDSTLLKTVALQLQLPEWFVHELICFGAVHWCPVPPKPKLEPLTTTDADKHKATQAAAQREIAIARFGKQPANAQPQRVIQDVPINQHAYIRVHLHPKRFPAAYSVDWKSCVVYDGPNFVVVDKPAGVQVISTVDNVLENVLACTTQALQLPEALLVTHRLDSCTQGLVALGKTVPFVQLFNKLLQKPGAVKKFYKTLTRHPPPLGRLQHYIKTGEHMKGQPVRSVITLGPGPGVQYCSLETLEVQTVSLFGAAAADWGPHAYESVLELHTGRTHQIRVQLAAEGCPLFGDSLYASNTAAAKLQAPFQGQEPTGAIGLQACKMSFAEGDMHLQCFEARQPWWREQHEP